MGEIVDWFTAEIRALGYAGLEGVYDYLSTMSDAEATQYLQSLLGSEKKIADFATSYIQKRSQGSRGEPSAASGSSSSTAQLAWAETSQPSRKSKRGKGKNKTLGKGNGHHLGNQQNQENVKSFARAVSKPPARKTEQMKAIQDAPVERMRQQVREYRKTKRPVNCIYCGKIECPVQENGACSFCGAPIFSIWKPSEPRQGVRLHPQTNVEENAVHGGDKRDSATQYCLVLGRYVRRPVLHGDVYIQPELRDLAGKSYKSRFQEQIEKTDDSSQSSRKKVPLPTASDPKDSKEQTKTVSKHGKETQTATAKFGDCAYSVQGRLLLDNLGSGVWLPYPKP